MVICLSERITMNKNKNTIHNQKHLTLTERIYIEQELVQGSKSRCRNCYKKNPTHVCPDFIPWNCGQLGKPPYVCNACDKYKWCPLPKALYVANKAQAS